MLRATPAAEHDEHEGQAVADHRELVARFEHHPDEQVRALVSLITLVDELEAES